MKMRAGTRAQGTARRIEVSTESAKEKEGAGGGQSGRRESNPRFQLGKPAGAVSANLREDKKAQLRAIRSYTLLFAVASYLLSLRARNCPNSPSGTWGHADRHRSQPCKLRTERNSGFIVLVAAWPTATRD